MDIINKRTDELKPYELNAKMHDERQIENVAESIRKFGWKQPLVIEKDGTIIIGHCRWEAAKKLGLEEVPCVVADELTDDEIRQLRIVDNKSNESDWDLELLASDLETIDMSCFDFDFTELSADFGENEWFQREQEYGNERQDGNEEYNEFLEKFEEKKTTDDCYTPKNVYECVADWVSKEYGIDRKQMKRPFFPGGDYENEKYLKGQVVVDNPPFSILSQIIDFFNKNEIPFFLFAPHTALSGCGKRGVCLVACGVDVTYENKAKINTCFITNMEKENVIRTAPDLYLAVKMEDERNEKETTRELPSYDYPTEVITASMANYMCKYGIDYKLKAKDSYFVRGLDEQKAVGKAIFGGGYLISEKAAAEKAAAEKAAAEKAAAEKAAAEKWNLSEREREIVKSLGK